MGQIAMTGLTTARYRIAQEIFILIVAIELLWNDDYNENYKLSVLPAKRPTSYMGCAQLQAAFSKYTP